MKWVVLAIAAFIVLSTAVNYFFRKPAQPHQPHAEQVQRTTAARLRAAGWLPLPATVCLPAAPAPAAGAALTRGARGLGSTLAACFVEPPPLFATIDRVSAPGTVNRGDEYSVRFAATEPDQRRQLGELLLYRRDRELVLLAVTERLPGPRLLRRWADGEYRASFATAELPPGRYSVRLVARGPAAEWTLTVR